MPAKNEPTVVDQELREKLQATEAALAVRSSEYEAAVKANQQLAQQVRSLKTVVDSIADQLGAMSTMLKGA